jgi:hypothetical protein
VQDSAVAMVSPAARQEAMSFAAPVRNGSGNMLCFPLREAALESHPMTQQILNWKHCVVGACGPQNAANEKTVKSRSLSVALIISNSIIKSGGSITQG